MDDVYALLEDRARSLQKARETSDPKGPSRVLIALAGHQDQGSRRSQQSADAHARRGVFWTYNAQGVQDLVKALYDSRYDLERIHYAPSFDHVTKDPMYNAIKIDSKVRLLILEGNWLLYDHQPWSTISTMMDDTWFVDVNEELALHRVATRHIESGIETTWSDAMHRATMNDMVNGYLVRSRLVAPKICVQSIEQVC